jgi:hypothetical protein
MTIVATVVIASVITAVVATIITSILVVVATIGPSVTVILLIGSIVTVIITAVVVLVIVVVALGFLGFRAYSEGTLQLLALPHGMFGVVMELTLVAHNHVEVTLKKGGRSWWVCHIGFTRSVVRPVSTVVVILFIEVVHHRVLSVN